VEHKDKVQKACVSPHFRLSVLSQNRSHTYRALSKRTSPHTQRRLPKTWFPSQPRKGQWDFIDAQKGKAGGAHDKRPVPTYNWRRKTFWLKGTLKKRVTLTRRVDIRLMMRAHWIVKRKMTYGGVMSPPNIANPCWSPMRSAMIRGRGSSGKHMSSSTVQRENRKKDTWQAIQGWLTTPYLTKAYGLH
jgi:hypothetical protein